jgi:hypothetical protein
VAAGAGLRVGSGQQQQRVHQVGSTPQLVHRLA